MATSLSIEMLPARHGDALWIEWGEADDRHRMLIDGGPTHGVDEVRRRIEQVEPSGRRLDLLIVTHIDLDHIGGVIELLEDDALGVSFDDIWFNDRRHLPEDSSTRGAVQGEYLARLLTTGDRSWNRAFGQQAVRVELSGPLPRVELAGGLVLTVLSPTPDKLLALRNDWDKTIEEAARKAEQRALDEEAAQTRGDRDVFGRDGSKANGSSIAVIVDYDDERWLLAGDAHSDVLLAGLQRYGAAVGERPVRLDGFKLPHHGSARNITRDLLAAIDCQQFLVSTDGSYFKHPDPACIDLIVESVDRPQLVFNYRSTFTEAWAGPSDIFSSSYPHDEPVTGLLESSSSAAALPSWAHESPAPSEADEEAIDREQDDASEFEPVAPTIRAVPELDVSVFHGSLERAAHPVLVGHYRATPLSGAEGFVDGRFAGRLSDRLATDKYPGDIGESLLIEAPPRKHPHRGVLVVGLGEYGELTPNRLVETVRAALVRYALDQADRRNGVTPIDLKISSVLLGGTGDQGLSISSSVRAVLDGVCDANRTLAARKEGPRAFFSALELWERNAPEAELSFLSLGQRPVTDDESGRTDSADFHPPRELTVADGALSDSLPVESGDAKWWRVRVADCSDAPTPAGGDGTPPDHLELEFTVGGRLARNGTVTHRVERRRLERILRDAVASASPTSGIHTTLFELLFPNQLKWDLMAAQDIQLEVDDVTADIPWEMLAARNPQQGERGQLALRASLVRQLRLPNIPPVRRSDKPTALVIGNPPVGGLAAPLPGAFREATAVSNVLRLGQYAVTDLCFDIDRRSDAATTMAIETALFAEDYRIIHVAAHGFFQPDDPTRTGIAIGPDDFLTATIFRQVNVIPDVVFLNCCHLGSVAFGVETGAIEFTRQNLHRLGASLARELINCGVRAVVVAGWAVHDRAAEKFAACFYEEMLRGKTFGWAVHSARWAAWKESRHHSTWGAYQCYGDGGYSLPQSGHEHHRHVGEPRTSREAARRLDELVNRIESVGINESSGDDRHRTEDDLTRIDEAAARRWSGNGHLCGQLAEAWKSMGDFDKAVEWYERAVAAKDGQVTLSDIEQLANLQDRLASSLVRNRRASKARRSRAAALVEQSMKTITLLEQLSQSGERSALRAGHHKRRATILQGLDRAEALEAAAGAYRRAYEQDGGAYALFNFIQLEEIRRRIAGDESRVGALIDDFERLLDQRDDSTYWASVALPDGQLTKAVIDGDIDARRGRLVSLYCAAFDSRSTWGQRSSTVDHLLDLAALHPDAGQSGALRALHDELAENLVS
jgi:beta-lactamase superfamily II metal-dependent hydrolase/tetratricopeptide (TPR) repeat protein